MFLGFANFYRRFIKGLSRLAALLTDVIRQSPLSREDSSIRVVANVQRDVDTSRGTTQGSKGSDGAVSLVQRDVDTSSTPTAEMTR